MGIERGLNLRPVPGQGHIVHGCTIETLVVDAFAIALALQGARAVIQWHLGNVARSLQQVVVE